MAYNFSLLSDTKGTLRHEPALPAPSFGVKSSEAPARAVVLFDPIADSVVF